MKINGGLYLVVDPMPGLKITLPKIKAALDGGVDVIQLWDHWRNDEPYAPFVNEVCRAAQAYNVPVLVHEQWQWLKDLPLNGLHLDAPRSDFQQIKIEINRPFLTGVTCGNEEDRIQWAIENKLDYISFCSLFPSTTAGSCEIVHPDLIKKTRYRTSIPIFVAGGIKLENISNLPIQEIDGLAIVSGIMKAPDPGAAARSFKQNFHEQKLINHDPGIL